RRHGSTLVAAWYVRSMSVCPLDGSPLRSDGTSVRDNRFGIERTVEIAWCPQCGLGVTLDPPSQAELAQLYETWYESGEAPQGPRPGSVGGRWHAVNGSLPLADTVRVGPVLDVGCNRGELLLALRDRGLQVVGLEPNPDAAAAARAKGLVVIEAPIETAEI